MQKKFIMKDLPQSRFALPVAIFLLILLAFGLLIPSIGFYWDDWPFAWLLRFFGPSDFIEAFRPFRPFLGPIFAVTTSIFGGNPLTWQLVGLGVRFLLSLVLWLVLRLVWPAQKLNLIWVVLLFTVYPRIPATMGGAYPCQPGIDPSPLAACFLWSDNFRSAKRTWTQGTDHSCPVAADFGALLNRIFFWS